MSPLWEVCIDSLVASFLSGVGSYIPFDEVEGIRSESSKRGKASYIKRELYSDLHQLELFKRAKN